MNWMRIKDAEGTEGTAEATLKRRGTYTSYVVRGFSLALCVLCAIAFPFGADQRPAPARPFDVVEKTIPELQAAMEKGEVTSKDLVALYLARIQAYDQAGPRLNAMIALNPRAAEIAAALDAERASGKSRGPLHGIPIVVKDNFETSDMATTAGSLALAGLQTRRDAFQVKKLRDAGAVILGKTNLHELASGITTISSLGGQTRNPYDVTRNPGGSSGGTGAAVAANFAAAGMGSDTCGSIRIPASHNSLFGLRGTAGLSSRDGVVPLSHTQDIGGPLARTVTDLAIVLDATVGADVADPVTAASAGRVPPSYLDALRADALKGARIGVLTNLFGDAPEDAEVRTIVRRALDGMKKEGAEIVDVTIPALEGLLSGTSVIDAEFKFDLADYLARAPSSPVRTLGEILDSGQYHASLDGSFRRRNRVESRDTDDYRRARIKREAVRQVVLATLDEHRVKALAYPTLRRKPAVIGEPQRGANCQLSPTTGLPALSMPAGFTDDGLPIGVELLGAAFSESDLLAFAFAYEQSAHPRRPPPSTPPLASGRPPAPATFTVTAADPIAPALVVRGSFTFDAVAGRLSYQIAASGVGSDELLAVTLQRTGDNDKGPVLARLVGPGGVGMTGEVVLTSGDRELLQAGRLSLVAYTRALPKGTIRARIPAR